MRELVGGEGAGWAVGVDAGMVGQAGDHALRLSRFAREMLTAAQSTRVDEDNLDPSHVLRVRIGMHVGPVSARLRPHAHAHRIGMHVGPVAATLRATRARASLSPSLPLSLRRPCLRQVAARTHARTRTRNPPCTRARWPRDRPGRTQARSLCASNRVCRCWQGLG